MDKLHNCSTCVFAKYCPATSGAAYFGAAPEEASYYCHVFEVVTEEGELEHCAVWVDADAYPNVEPRGWSHGQQDIPAALTAHCCHTCARAERWPALLATATDPPEGAVYYCPINGFFREDEGGLDGCADWIPKEEYADE